jgi:nucleotide-binding universal stress UspA family protein
MFRDILVPADLTEKNRSAVQVAADLVRGAGAGARVTLLHVIETIDHVPFEELADFYATLQAKAETGLEELAGRFAAVRGEADEAAEADEADEAPPVELQRRVVFGHRARAIVDFAGEQGCDLIVLSSHRVDPDRRGEDWATLSHKVAILAPCPVLLVK